MRMTRESYAKEVWKVVQAVREGQEAVPCPHEDCNKLLQVVSASVQAGTTILCPQHGVIFRQ